MRRSVMTLAFATLVASQAFWITPTAFAQTNTRGSFDLTSSAAMGGGEMRGGGASYSTGFEAPDFAPGELRAQAGWGTQWLGDWTVDSANPAEGTQHARSFVAFTGSSAAISPTTLADATAFSSASVRVAITNVGTGSSQLFAPQDPTAALIVTRVRFNVNGNIEVLQPDPANPGSGLFIDTGADWAAGYNDIKVVADRVGGLEVCLGTTSIFTGTSFSPDIENVAFISGMETGSQGSIGDFDNLEILNTDTGGCGGGTNPGGPVTLIDEDFQSGFPAGWTNVNSGTTSCPWLVPHTGYPMTGLSATASPGAGTDSDDCGVSGMPVGGIDSRLLTPVMDLSDVIDTELTFDVAYRHVTGGRLDLDVTTDGGTTWTNLQTWGVTTGGTSPNIVGVPTTVDLSAYDGESSVQLRWRYFSGWHWFAYVDNVVVGGTSTGGGGGDDLVLETTVALDNGDPAQCGTADNLSASVGDQINFCYTVTNDTAETLNFHTLDDSVDGNIFTNQPQTLAPGDSYQFNRMVTASASATHDGTWTGATALPGYTPDDAAPFSAIDISTTGTNLNLTDDSEAGVTLPFQFEFYGVSSDQLCVGNNGGIIFGTLTCEIGFTNSALPATTLGPAIFPFWDDFDDETGGVFWQVQGSAPNRIAVIQWHNRPHFTSPQPPTPDTATVQVLLFEGSNEIVFQYPDVNFSNPVWDFGATATIGLQNANGAISNQYSFDTASLSNGMAILWESIAPVSFTATDSVTLDVGAPIITVDPTEINAAAAPGASTTANLTIGNDGDRDLEWEIEEAPSDAHFPATPRTVVRKNDVGQTAAAEPINLEAYEKYNALRGSSRSATFGLLGGATVPAYTTTGFAIQDYVSLDALVPGTLNTIASPGPGNIYAATFIDNDFSQHWFIASANGTIPTGSFGHIDTATGVATVLGTVSGAPAGTTWTSAKWDAATGNVYALASGGGGVNALYTVNPTTGAATLVGQVSGGGLGAGAIVIAIAIAPNGLMYGIDIIDDVFFAINKATGAASVIGPTGVNANFAQDMDFDPTTGTLYWAAYIGSGNTQMQTVNLTTGQATLVAPIGSQAELLSFTIAVPSGSCATPEDTPWLSVGTPNGTIVPGGADQVSVITLNATGLTDGFYRANLCVNSNDPANGTVAVPVEFVVGNPPPEEADLAITLADSPDPVDINGSVTITATVENIGPQAVTEASAEIVLPAELAFVSASASGAGTWNCANAGGTVTCELSGSLASGATADLAIVADVAAGVTPPTTAETTATVISAEWPDPDTGNNSDTEETSIAGELPIFANGFECDTGFPGCGGTPGVYTDRTTFLQNVAPGFFENPFNDAVPGAIPSMTYTGGGVSYTITASTDQLFNDTGLISTNLAGDSIVVTITAGTVTAIGGNFWASDISVVPTGTEVVLTLSNGTVETFTSSGPSDFRGFVASAPITSITIDAPDTGGNFWPTMDNLIVGQ